MSMIFKWIWNTFFNYTHFAVHRHVELRINGILHYPAAWWVVYIQKCKHYPSVPKLVGEFDTKREAKMFLKHLNDNKVTDRRQAEKLYIKFKKEQNDE